MTSSSPWTIDHQPTSDLCAHCGEEYPVSRGTVYEHGQPFGLYLAGMHGCEGKGSVVLGLGVLPADGVKGNSAPDALTIQVWLTDDEYQMSVIDPDESPWKQHAYLGRMLSRNEVLNSPRKTLFFDLATSIVRHNAAVESYLETS